jgi:hypothetical protein
MLADAVGRVLDDTIFFGTGAPASWTGANIVAKAVAASNFVNLGTATAPAGLLGDISLTFAKVEEDGFDVKAAVSKAATRGALRAAMITSEAMAAQATTNEVWGVPITYAMGGLWPTSANAAQLIAGDFSQGVLGVRQDITYTTFDQGVITDAAGVVVQNLMQQDLVAIRVVARYAFAVPNPVTRDNANASTRYPFAVLRNAT